MNQGKRARTSSIKLKRANVKRANSNAKIFIKLLKRQRVKTPLKVSTTSKTSKPLSKPLKPFKPLKPYETTKCMAPECEVGEESSCSDQEKHIEDHERHVMDDLEEYDNENWKATEHLDYYEDDFVEYDSQDDNNDSDEYYNESVSDDLARKSDESGEVKVYDV